MTSTVTEVDFATITANPTEYSSSHFNGISTTGTGYGNISSIISSKLPPWTNTTTRTSTVVPENATTTSEASLTPTCAAGQTYCSNSASCTDLRSDTHNCGECNAVVCSSFLLPCLSSHCIIPSHTFPSPPPKKKKKKIFFFLPTFLSSLTSRKLTCTFPFPIDSVPSTHRHAQTAAAQTSFPYPHATQRSRAPFKTQPHAASPVLTACAPTPSKDPPPASRPTSAVKI
jgi:hypothetical protein